VLSYTSLYGIADGEFIAVQTHHRLLKTWDCLQPHIEGERKRRGAQNNSAAWTWTRRPSGSSAAAASSCSGDDGVMSHSHHTFRNPPPATPGEVRAAFGRGDLDAALDAMVGCALHGEGDWREAQELYLALLDHPDHQVQALAATCLGHLARVRRRLDEGRVVGALRAARARPHVRGTAGDALDDIGLFLHPRRARWRGRLWRLVHPRSWF
jgi:hypothetical protein